MDIKDAVLGSFELPLDVAFDVPKIMVMGNNQIFVENYVALAEYKRDNIKLITKQGMTEICGNNFEIKVMKEKNIAISGIIESIRLI